MTREDLIALLTKTAGERGGDEEASHSTCERALLSYVNDPEIAAAWEAAAKYWWYA